VTGGREHDAVSAAEEEAVDHVGVGAAVDDVAHVLEPGPGEEAPELVAVGVVGVLEVPVAADDDGAGPTGLEVGGELVEVVASERGVVATGLDVQRVQADADARRQRQVGGREPLEREAVARRRSAAGPRHPLEGADREPGEDVEPVAHSGALAPDRVHRRRPGVGLAAVLVRRLGPQHVGVGAEVLLHQHDVVRVEQRADERLVQLRRLVRVHPLGQPGDVVAERREGPGRPGGRGRDGGRGRRRRSLVPVVTPAARGDGQHDGRRPPAEVAGAGRHAQARPTGAKRRESSAA
jgi:hypothetical protein